LKLQADNSGAGPYDRYDQKNGPLKVADFITYPSGAEVMTVVTKNKKRS
jgi:hypothetical protein